MLRSAEPVLRRLSVYLSPASIAAFPGHTEPPITPSAVTGVQLVPGEASYTPGDTGASMQL